MRTLFFLLGLLLILAWSILLFFTLNTKSMLLYVGEGVISFSLIVLFYFYRKVVKPLNSIASGMDLLREQDFSSRLASVGQAEADRIVEMFNRMMNQLKNERLRLREQNHFLDLLINVSPMGGDYFDFRRADIYVECGGVAVFGICFSRGINGKTAGRTGFALGRRSGTFT